MTTYGASQLAKSFRTVRKNTIQVAEDIPEEKYGFVAAPGMRSVAQMLTHIALVPRIWLDMHGTKRLKDVSGYDFMGEFGKLQAEESKSRSKADLVALLRVEGEQFASFLESLSDAFLAEHVQMPEGQGSKSRLEALMSPKEHEMHHRAQLMVIQRLIGVVPHLTRQFEEWVRQQQATQGAGQRE